MPMPQLFPLLLLLPLLIATPVVCANTAPTKTPPAKLRILAYKSLVGKGSWGEWLGDSFQKNSGASVEWQSFSAAGEALGQLALSRKSCPADIILGIDNSFEPKATTLGKLETLPADLYEGLAPVLKDSLGGSRELVPFDYGYLAFIYDADRTTVPTVKSLSEFATLPGLDKKVIVLDPRVSSVGLSFLLWSHAESLSGVRIFWQALRPKILTVATGWSSGYGIFLKGNSDYVLSYTTSPAYHIEMENKQNYRAVAFAQGHFQQVEGLGILKCSKQKALAQAFARHALSKEAQEALPTRQWMYPAREGVKLPASFSKLVSVEKPVCPPGSYSEAMRARWVQDWEKVFVESP